MKSRALPTLATNASELMGPMPGCACKRWLCSSCLADWAGAAADDALEIGKQDYLQEHGRKIGGYTSFVIAEAGIEAGQVEFVIEQVIQSMLEGAGQQLPLQVNGEKPGASVDVFVARHRCFIHQNNDG